MGARQQAQADGIGVFLERGLGDLIRGLEQAGVDDLEAGVAQARAITLAPRSCPSRPGLAITTR